MSVHVLEIRLRPYIGDAEPKPSSSDTLFCKLVTAYNDCLVQDCSNSIVNALELLQSCNKPSIMYTSELTLFCLNEDNYFAIVLCCMDCYSRYKNHERMTEIYIQA